MFKDRMRVEPIPERVFALCCILLRGPVRKNELREKLEPPWIVASAGTSYFPESLQVAKDLGLIKEIENTVHLIVDKVVLESIDSFRRHTARRAFQDKDSMFYQYTSWYLSQNEKYFDRRNPDQMVAALGTEVPGVTDNDLRGWRFWAAFFGIGLLHDMFLIPNTYLRLYDALVLDRQEIGTFTKGKLIPFSQFFSWLKVNCPETVEVKNSHELCLGLSQGLRMLYDQGMITMEDRPDTAEKWNLFYMPTHKVPRTISDIVINI